MKGFASYSSLDSLYVLEVVGFLRRHFDVTAYELDPHAHLTIKEWVDQAFRAADVWLVFIGDSFDQSRFQQQEAQEIASQQTRHQGRQQLVTIGLDAEHSPEELPGSVPNAFQRYEFLPVRGTSARFPAEKCAREIVRKLRDDSGVQVRWQAIDGLPVNPHLFSYEKEIAEFFTRQRCTTTDAGERGNQHGEHAAEDERRLVDGCPPYWPQIKDLTTGQWMDGDDPNPLVPDDIGTARSRDADVAVAAVNSHRIDSSLRLPEAGPRQKLAYPVRDGAVKVGVLVAGGIAPGINAVIDGIVQRHWKYASRCDHELVIRGYENGLRGLLDGQHFELFPDHARVVRQAARPIVTADAANQGGSMLGTYRMHTLLSPTLRLDRLKRLAELLDGIDILYMIGGDGTMKAAHALWKVAVERLSEPRPYPLSVVAIPNTMDNDVLWVWQSFGFMSAVGRAHEFLEHLHTEIRSNPRIGVVQLFGSDSGFIVAHAVLACASGHCDLALIPEVPFSLPGIARHLSKVISQRGEAIPRAVVAMAEAAVPSEIAWYLDPSAPLPDALGADDRGAIEAVREALSMNDLARSPMSEVEVKAVRSYEKDLRAGRRIQGQTSDELRRAGLKIVRIGLETILKLNPRGVVHWNRLRMLSNEPRHLLRAIPPSPSDIIMGQRLGALAVDNAMAGYTDCMISQWLTEYVLVPLPLVALGRKRVPIDGIFWKSVLAKTGQVADLRSPWPEDLAVATASGP